jgi:hypothetical protein
MADENPELDDEPPPDPFEAELIAYLDGELDPVAARKVEARLARDPAARARAAELKKSFDLLDYLPKPEPSPNFTSRTLDKLPTVKPAHASTPTQAPAKSRPVPTAASASSSVPVPLEIDDEQTVASAARTGRVVHSSGSVRWTRVAGICAGVALCGLLGYFATAVGRHYLFPARDRESAEVDPRVIENLPLYAVADDIGFVGELAKPEYFGEDPAVAFEPGLKIPTGDPGEKPSAKQYDGLLKSFRALPAARRAEIINLDRDLFALDPRTRDRYFRALEAYAVWLERVSEAERRGVLSAPTAGERLGAIRDARRQQAGAPPLFARPDFVNQWHKDDAQRREHWSLHRRRAAALAASKKPWPFDAPNAREEVGEFARDVLRVGDLKNRRLSAEELADYGRALKEAQDTGSWGGYGLIVYELAELHPYLPEPADSKLITEERDLPADVAKHLVRKIGPGVPSLPFALRAESGRWPEFPLEAHRELRGVKFGPNQVTQLGPARLEDFKPAVRTLAEQELFPKMTAEEKRELQTHVGRWPAYPQRFLHYAHKYDLPVPGVTLPFSPKRWDATYGIHPNPPAK